MEKVTMIQELYFMQNKTLTEISEIIGTSVSYISKILKKDERYNKEKEKRKKENLSRRRKLQKEMIYKNRRNIIDIEYINMKKQHEEASREFSKRSVLSTETLRKWCGSAYQYNPKKKRYEFKTEELLKPVDFPAYINI